MTESLAESGEKTTGFLNLQLARQELASVTSAHNLAIAGFVKKLDSMLVIKHALKVYLQGMLDLEDL